MRPNAGRGPRHYGTMLQKLQGQQGESRRRMQKAQNACHRTLEKEGMPRTCRAIPKATKMRNQKKEALLHKEEAVLSLNTFNS